MVGEGVIGRSSLEREVPLTEAVLSHQRLSHGALLPVMVATDFLWVGFHHHPIPLNSLRMRRGGSNDGSGSGSGSGGGGGGRGVGRVAAKNRYVQEGSLLTPTHGFAPLARMKGAGSGEGVSLEWGL